MNTTYSKKNGCYHCGEDCLGPPVVLKGKSFCCEGCKMVYHLLSESDMCEYYQLNDKPGNNMRSEARRGKFTFLDNPSVKQSLITFQEGERVHVTFYLPTIHCSSCLWILENLYRLNPAISRSMVNFPRKEVDIVFNEERTSLRNIAELLTSLGYEPYIPLKDFTNKKQAVGHKLIIRLGVAGFCFSNIMLFSFPEYLGITSSDADLQVWFRALSLILALPVLLFCAQPFYVSALKSLAHKHLNIDAPISLAISVTFIRSAYEVLSQSGNGYFDSMSGIVFFMLIGKVLQEKTYRQLSFDRDYTSYFPIAITVLKDDREYSRVLPDIKPGDTLLIHHDELIPADGILTKGRAYIDYGFVTGESKPVIKQVGDLVYAGGKQTGANIELLTIKDVSQSYLTGLWNNKEKNEHQSNPKKSFVNSLSKYFTYIVFSIAFIFGIYWQLVDPSKAWNVITSILIVACPCALLLASTFSNGNVLRILSRNYFYLRNAQTIETIASVDHIVFDKTGTLTSPHDHDINFTSDPLSPGNKQIIASLAAQSRHPLSRALASHLSQGTLKQVTEYSEEPGRGIKGIIDGKSVRLGSREFVQDAGEGSDIDTKVFVSIDERALGSFVFRHRYRNDLAILLDSLKKIFTISVLSGDNSTESAHLKTLFDKDTVLHFQQTPADKQSYINELQKSGQCVMMIGDGLNDAGALSESRVGVAICENANNFTPASDAIIEAKQLALLPAFMRLCRLNEIVVRSSFAFSIVYNVIGVYFAASGYLSPMIAAILMPASSISILIISFGSTNLIAKNLRL